MKFLKYWFHGASMKIFLGIRSNLIFNWLILFLFCSNICAVEYRSPNSINHGPMRYFFEQESETFSARWWSAINTKYARKAFGHEHGRKFEELPALFFNQADMRMSHMFQDCLVRTQSEFYNPLVRTANLRLRAEYFETGVTFGARWDYPFTINNSNQGRVGIRGTIPLKRCKVQKKDNEGVRSGAELQDVISIQPATAEALSNINSTTSDRSIMIRLDLLEALVQSSQRNSFMNYSDTSGGPGSAEVKAGRGKISLVPATPATGYPGTGGNEQRNLSLGAFAFIYSPEGLIPRPSEGNNIVAFSSTDDSSPVSNHVALKAFPKDAILSPGEIYVFDQKAVGNNASFYKNLADSAEKGVANRRDDQANKATVWAIPFAERTTTGVIIPGTGISSGGIPITANTLAEQITENAYEWLHDRGMDFETFTADDFGDLFTEVFYEQQINDKMLFEINGGITFPTGGKAKYKNNPYQIYAGNGGHVEVSAGGSFAFRFNDYANIKADGRYHWVLNKVEERAATFRGSAIKNIGPKIEADVKWQYFNGSVDLNLTHPGTHTITGTIGYGLTYKREDVVKFALEKMNSWMGKLYNATTSQFNDDLHELDNKLAAAHTNAIAHKLRIETSYLLSDWLEFFWGGAWTFAGRNTPYDIEGHTGFHVAF